ncbi:MAG: AAA family ATPase, partial [Gammaproteobacteria bacterium]
MRDEKESKSTYLDFEWVESALEKRRANFSNVICFETRDPRRRNQSLAYLMGSTPEYRQAEIYAFDYWNGLRRVNRQNQGRFEPVSRGVQGTYEGTVENPIAELKEALRYMDEILRGRRVVFILQDFDEAKEGDKNQDLINAMRAWSHGQEITVSGSLVILHVGSASKVLDELTLDLVILKRPDIASPSERAKILQEISEKCEVQIGPEKEAIVLATAGLNLHQLRCILIESYSKTGGFPPEIIKDLKAELIRRSDLLELEEPDPRGFGSVGGYEAVKRFISENVVRVLSKRERAMRFAVPLPRGILFFGPPGTGKTLFAKALARGTNLPFINLRTENLYSKYLGESGQRFREAIRLAEQMSPAIVFIDEIDRFGRRSSASSDGASEETRRVFNQVLEWLGSESRKSIIVGTTNRPQDLDEAFTRAGRFDYKIPFLYPGRTARKQILDIHLGLVGTKPQPPFEISEHELGATVEEVASRAENFSGAELEQLVLRAKRNAFNRDGNG